MASTMVDLSNEYMELNNYKKVLVIPVPISRKRLKKRGFNQAEVLAKEILINLYGYELKTDIIFKIKDRTPQASIKNRSVRLKSPEGTFKVVNEKHLLGTLCIVVDDITTTGGTINEVRRMLIASGAQDVIGVTIAH